MFLFHVCEIRSQAHCKDSRATFCSLLYGIITDNYIHLLCTSKKNNNERRIKDD